MSPSDTTIQSARESGNPVVDGNRATFLWEGDSAPQLIGDITSWEDKPKSFKRLAPTPKGDTGTTIWSCSLTIPRDGYLEYAFYDPFSREKILDPLNEDTVSNGMGSRNNFFYMPEATPSPFAMRRAGIRSGTLTRHRVDADFLQDDSERDVYLYKSPVNGAVPLLIVYDGYDYLY